MILASSITTLCLLGTGCVHFVPRPLDAEGQGAALLGRHLATKTWTLQLLIDEAIQSHPEVALARAQYETAKAAIRTAGESPNPTIAISPQVATPAPPLINGTYAIDFDWTIETAGKRSARVATAHANARAASAQVIETAWNVRVAVRKALLDLYAGEQRAKVLGEAISQQENLLKLMDERIEAGTEARAVSAQPRLLQAQLRLQAEDAAKNVSLAKVALAQALGMGTAGLAGVTFSYAAFERVPGGHLAHQRQALTHRADILVALANYAAAEATLRLEIAKQYPDVHLNPGYQLDEGTNKWNIGVGLTLPILNQNHGAIGEAEAKRAEAAAKFNVVQARVLADCDRATAAYRAAVRKVATADDMITTQNRQVTSEERLVAAGGGDKVAWLSAQVERSVTQMARLDALVELQTALGAIEEATQTPLDP